MSMILKLRLVIILFITFTNPVAVWAGDDSKFQTWSDITTTYNISDSWQYIGDQGIRGVVSDSDFTLLYFRPSVSYQVNPEVTVMGGVRFFQTFFDDGEDTFEVGPWQGLQFVWPKLGDYTISHYMRLEERMIWQTGAESDYDFTLRTRYQLGARSPDFDILFKNGLYLLGTVEWFWNSEETLPDNYINRIRYDVGGGTKISGAWQVQLHFIMHQDRGSLDSDFSIDEHILRLRLFYTFN